MAIGGKPFSLQAPEQIAKEYGGDKQRIMQAAQMGVVDPTAALMAAMFIDRIRTAQTAEQSAPSTVAQDVFAPPAPAGLGAMPAPMQAAPGMAQPTPPAGGIEALPVPEAMFPEEGAGMAGGGIVAFQSGGGIRSFTDLIAQLESRGRDFDEQGRPLTSPTGARYSMQVMPATARDPGFGIRPAQADTPEEYNRVGREYSQMLLNRYGNQTDALVAYNWGPGNADRWIAAGRGMNRLPRETRQYLQRAASYGENVPASTEPAPITGTPPLSLEEFSQMVTPRNQRGLEGNVEMFRQVFDQYLPDTSAIEETIADLRSRNTPEEAKVQREQDLWSALADFGFKWAASGNLAESAGETFSGLRETLDSRREEELDNLTRIIQLEGMQIDRAMPAIEAGAAAYNNEQEASDKARSYLANYATTLGSVAASGTEQRKTAALEAQLNPPGAAGGMTPSQATQLGQQVIEDFGKLDSDIVEDTQSIPQYIKDLHAAARAGQIDEATAFRQGAQYYFSAFTGGGAGSAGTPALPAGFVMEGGPRLPAAPASGSAGNAWQDMMRGITSPR